MNIFIINVCILIFWNCEIVKNKCWKRKIKNKSSLSYLLSNILSQIYQFLLILLIQGHLKTIDKINKRFLSNMQKYETKLEKSSL